MNEVILSSLLIAEAILKNLLFDVSGAMKNKILTMIAAFFPLISLISALPAVAAPGDSIALYLSAPLVQGSSVNGAGTQTENFNSFTGAAWPGADCPSSTAVGTITSSTLTGGAQSGLSACRILTPQGYGGAESQTADPSFGGNGTNFAATLYRDPNPAGTITFTFPSAVKYVGFWWSAGNAGNTVEFLNNGIVVASYDSSQMMTLLGGSVPSPYPGSASLTSLNGSSYLKGRYFGNPRGFTTLTPNTRSSIDDSSVFAYLNLFLGGTTSVDAVRFSGQGFEFDNLTTSINQQTPDGSLVFASSVLGKSVQFMPNGSGVIGTMPAQTDSSTANLTANSFSRPGYTFIGWNTQANNQGTPYSDQSSYNFANDLTLHAQWSLGTYQVSFDSQGGSSTSPSSYQTGGTVTLPNAPTKSGYHFDGWFATSSGGNALTSPYAPPSYGAITLYAQWTALPSQTVIWSPTNLTMTSSPSLPNAIATTSGDGQITYSVVNGGSTGCSVNPNSGEITFNNSGTCTIRATASATSSFLATSVDKTFNLVFPAANQSAGVLATTGSNFFFAALVGLSALASGLFLFRKKVKT
jgi:uncharacterized repeat protein (TIGR02543 family)/LPXTG-motif cell wall-anchored protein